MQLWPFALGFLQKCKFKRSQNRNAVGEDTQPQGSVVLSVAGEYCFCFWLFAFCKNTNPKESKIQSKKKEFWEHPKTLFYIELYIIY